MDIKNKRYYWSINVFNETAWLNNTYSFIVQAFVLRWNVNISLNTTKPPLTADVNHDGIYEVFVIGNDHIWCLNSSSGTIKWRYDNAGLLGYDSQMEIGDLNNDGIDELVASAQTHTIALHANNGTEYWNVKYNSSNKNIVIADIEGNRYPYVYIASDDPEHGENGTGRIRKLNGVNGALLAETFAFRPCYGSLSLADCDNDGKFELYSTDRGYDFSPPGETSAGRGMICYDADTLKILWYTDKVTCSSHCQVLVDVNNDGILDSVAMQEIGNGIYIIDGKTWDKMMGKWGENLDDLTAHSQPTVYDIDNDGNLELMTCSNAQPKIWDLGSWSLEDTNLSNASEPPEMANVIKDGQLEIIDAQNKVNIYNQNYQLLETINTPASAHTLVQDLDNDGRNELILLSHQNVIVYNTSGVAPAKLPRTNCEFYSERRTGAGVYVPPPGAPQPIIKDVFPKNNSQDIQPNPILCVHLIDFHYDLMNITISTNASGSWRDLTTFHDVRNGWYNITTTQMDQSHTTYYWRVSAIDPYADKMTTTSTYTFTTETSPVITNIHIYPSLVLPGQSVNISCNVTDNSFVNLVKTNISYPDGSTTNIANLGGEPSWYILAYDDFESGFGNYTDGGTDCLLYSGSTYAYQGNKAAEVRDYKDINSSFFLTQSRDLDTPRSISLKVDFWFITHGLESRENLWVKYFDGTHWQLVADYLEGRDFQNDIFYHKIVLINETDYVFPKDMKIRFQCDASDDSDNIYIDQVYINATAAQGPRYYCNYTFTQEGIYQYFIWANDTSGNGISSITHSFKIGGDNLPPYISGNPSPLNGSINNPLNFTWRIPINDYEGDRFDWTIQCSNGQTNSSTGAANGTKSLDLSGLAYSATYKIWVNATDPSGSDLYTRKWYVFTTIVELPPVFGLPTPTNGSTNKPLNLTWSIPISDPDGDRFDWTIQCSNGQINNESNDNNGTKSLALSGLAYFRTYKVWVNATDPSGSGLYTRRWYTITTMPQSSPPGGGGGGGTSSGGQQNEKPIANSSSEEPYNGYINSPILFNGSRSWDPNGYITEWFWIFGDDTNGTGEIVWHTYTQVGTYTVTLIVTNNIGLTDSDTTTCVIIQPNRPPTKPIITGPIHGTTNTSYNLSVVSTDADNDTIRYTIIWGNLPSDVNRSGFLSSNTSFVCSHRWTIPGQYEITVIASDNQGESSTQYDVTIEAEKKEAQPSTPGFELVFALGAIIIVILYWRRNLKEEN